MDTLSLTAYLVLAGGGFLAGVVNTLAGGGSLLTVPLLVLCGLPGTVANGTNRIGVVVMNLVAAWRFRRRGVSGIRAALPVLVPVTAGSLLGATLISMADDRTFEQLFGVAMVLLIYPVLRPARRLSGSSPRNSTAAARAVAMASYFAIGLYGGALQAGIGILLVAALSYAGHDLLRAASIKVVVNFVQAAIVVPVFVYQGQVAWWPAAVLAAGFAAGGEAGARLAVRGGDAVIRPVLGIATLALAGKMIGLY